MKRSPAGLHPHPALSIEAHLLRAHWMPRGGVDRQQFLVQRVAFRCWLCRLTDRSRGSRTFPGVQMRSLIRRLRGDGDLLVEGQIARHARHAVDGRPLLATD